MGSSIVRFGAGLNRGLLSLDNMAQLSRIASETQRKLQFILVVPARRYHELDGMLDHMHFAAHTASITEAASPNID
jgi:hypothetical protein